ETRILRLLPRGQPAEQDLAGIEDRRDDLFRIQRAGAYAAIGKLDGRFPFGHPDGAFPPFALAREIRVAEEGRNDVASGLRVSTGPCTLRRVVTGTDAAATGGVLGARQPFGCGLQATASIVCGPCHSLGQESADHAHGLLRAACAGGIVLDVRMRTARRMRLRFCTINGSGSFHRATASATRPPRGTPCPGR